MRKLFKLLKSFSTLLAISIVISISSLYYNDNVNIINIITIVLTQITILGILIFLITIIKYIFFKRY